MLNVLFASNEDYAPFLSIAIFSLLKNNEKEFNQIDIYVLDDGISDKNKNNIEKIIKHFNCTLSFIKTKKIEKLGINIMPLERNFNISSLTNYSRLFISNVLPEEIEKILYLDCDSLIVGSLKELWKENITEYYCAGVLDCINTTIKQKCGFSKEEDYINSGVLLINLKKWRENNVENDFIQFMIKNQNKFYQHDQGIINNVFKNKILIVNPKYNLQIHFQSLDYDLSRKYNCIETEYYTKKIIMEAQENPVFLHFCGANYFRPWYNQAHPYADLFKKYASTVGCEYVIDYSVSLPKPMILFYKISNNILGKFFIKIIPGYFVRKMINKNALKAFEEDNNKAKTEKNK